MLRSPGLNIAASLQDIDKLYNRLIACIIFEIHLNTRFYYLKTYFEDFLKLWPFCFCLSTSTLSESDRNAAEALQHRLVWPWSDDGVRTGKRLSNFQSRLLWKLLRAFCFEGLPLNRYKSGFQNGWTRCISIVVTDFLIVKQFVEFFFKN